MIKSLSLPKISIVTPSFNQGQFLEATIQSILTQNYPNLEYIIIDGGSTDGSIEIIKKYEKYLHYWCSEEDDGHYDGINKGLSHATGEIMAWLNSDDLYCPWALITVASVFSQLSEVEWLTTLKPIIWDWQGFCLHVKTIPGYSKEGFLDGRYLPSAFREQRIGWIQQESTFWKRSLWEKIGGYISLDFPLAGDFDLWSRFYQYSDLYGVDSPLGGFRSQHQQKSRQIKTYSQEAQQSLEKLREKLEWSPNKIRDIAFNSSLCRLPKFRGSIIKNYGYCGQKIIRRNADSSDGFWQIRPSFFLGFPGCIDRDTI